MFGNKEINDKLQQILNQQDEVLKVLKSIDNNIVKYFGEEYEAAEKELRQEIFDAHFTKKQFEVLKKTIDHTREKHSKKNDICKVTNLPCCYCQPVCNSRKDT